MPKQGGAVAKRLRMYWQMEAGNAVIVPVAAIGLVLWGGGAATMAMWISAVACSVLLVIGALYWRALLRRVEGASDALEKWLPRLAAVELWSLALVCAAVIATVWELSLSGWTWNGARIAAAVLTALAALEFVNYYHIQLQHFDNWADFKRLVTGRGFRKAHMARDIAEWRSTARSGTARKGGD